MHIDLALQQLLVLCQDLVNRLACAQVVLRRRHHAVLEEVRDPLGRVELVELVSLDTVTQQTIDELTDVCHG